LRVVIPTIGRKSLSKTIDSINNQTLKPKEIVVIYDQGKGANWARNQGLVKKGLMVFSDDDITWAPDAFESLYNALGDNAYSYGWYEQDGQYVSDKTFDPEELKRLNYISTMSMVKAEVFPGFDENIQRLQDWDVWLTMLEQGHHGTFCGKQVFSTTACPDGITHNTISWREAERIVKEKHGL
jgi:glycosyltransferase involved in cell wall biosynthesis